MHPRRNIQKAKARRGRQARWERQKWARAQELFKDVTLYVDGKAWKSVDGFLRPVSEPTPWITCPQCGGPLVDEEPEEGELCCACETELIHGGRR